MHPCNPIASLSTVSVSQLYNAINSVSVSQLYNIVCCLPPPLTRLSQKIVSVSQLYNAINCANHYRPETFRGEALPASDVFSFAMVAYQIGSLLQPFAGETEQEIRDQLEPFRPSEAQARRGRSVEEQLIDWEQDYPLVTRRPNLATLQPECPTVLRALIAECWGDEFYSSC